MKSKVVSVPDLFTAPSVPLADDALYLTLRRQPESACTLPMTAAQQRQLLSGVPMPVSGVLRIKSRSQFPMGKVVTVNQGVRADGSTRDEWTDFQKEVKSYLLRNPSLLPAIQVEEWESRDRDDWTISQTQHLVGNPGLLPSIFEEAVDEYVANPRVAPSFKLKAFLQHPQASRRLVDAVLRMGEHAVGVVIQARPDLLTSTDFCEYAKHSSDLLRAGALRAVLDGHFDAPREVMMQLVGDESKRVTDLAARHEALVWSEELPVRFFQRYAPEDFDAVRARLRKDQREVWDALVTSTPHQSVTSLVQACQDVVR